MANQKAMREAFGVLYNLLALTPSILQIVEELSGEDLWGYGLLFPQGLTSHHEPASPASFEQVGLLSTIIYA